MIRHGEAPYLECSSKGDKRFSAFFARVRAYNNRTIEEIYQSAKTFGGNPAPHWKMAKGKVPDNPAGCALLYSSLWDCYIRENPELLPILKAASGLSDVFGKPGSVCQATELWRIRG